MSSSQFFRAPPATDTSLNKLCDEIIIDQILGQVSLDDKTNTQESKLQVKIDEEELYWQNFWAEVDEILSKVALDSKESKAGDYTQSDSDDEDSLNPDLKYSDKDYVERLLSTLKLLDSNPEATKDGPVGFMEHSFAREI